MIGITGGIGSGKSRICRELIRRGYSVYDCDREAKRIIHEDPAVRAAICALFGDEAFEGERYNTVYVAKRVFAEPALLERLNTIVHPAVKADVISKNPDFVESAILYEAGLDPICEKVVVVDAPEDIRIERTIGRDYNDEMTPENINKVRARMRAQKHHTGDLLIWNDGKTPTPEVVDKLTHWLWKN